MSIVLPRKNELVLTCCGFTLDWGGRRLTDTDALICRTHLVSDGLAFAQTEAQLQSFTANLIRSNLTDYILQVCKQTKWSFCPISLCGAATQTVCWLQGSDTGHRKHFKFLFEQRSRSHWNWSESYLKPPLSFGLSQVCKSHGFYCQKLKLETIWKHISSRKPGKKQQKVKMLCVEGAGSLLYCVGSVCESACLSCSSLK